MFITDLAKIWNQSKCPSMDEWIKKLCCVYIHMCVCVCVCIMEYYSAIKRIKFAIGDNMDGPQGHSAKWNTLEKHKCNILLFVEFKEQKQAHRYRKQTGGCKMWGWELGVRVMSELFYKFKWNKIFKEIKIFF